MIRPVKYFGYGLLFVLVLILIHKTVWKYVFSILLILAVFGLVQVFDRAYQFGFGPILFDLTSLILLIFHIVLNSDIIISIAKLTSANATELENNSIERQKDQETGISIYLDKFKNKTEAELHEIIESHSYTFEAKEAAKRFSDNIQHDPIE